MRIDIENKDQVIRWLENLKRGTGDARPFWRALTPRITEFVEKQFDYSSDSGKRWKSLTDKYVKFKAKKGFHPGIGVMTGLLGEGAGKRAIKKYKRKELLWSVNQGLVQNKGKKYAGFFHKDRPIYDMVAIRLNSFLGIDIQKFTGGSKNSITYLWLRNELRKLQ